MEITPKQFYAQWLRLGPAQATVSHFERQIHGFTYTAGLFAKDRFQRSFDEGQLYGLGQPWPARASRWGQRRGHPVMNHSGLLRSVIGGDTSINDVTRSPAPGRKAQFLRNSKYTIDINPASVAWPGHRGVRKNGLTQYAAVHNADPNTSGFTVNQYSTRKPERRQFIGHSPKLYAEIARYYPYIFNGLPGIGNSPSPL